MITWLRDAIQLESRWARFRLLRRAVGSFATLQMIARKFWPGAEFRLHPRQLLYPICMRKNTSDYAVFDQIFVEQEYACIEELPKASLIIDCGANVGYSSAYFLSQHPDCHVIAVEPDDANFFTLRQNLVPYGERAKCIRGGVWSHSTHLCLAANNYRDGRGWARQVRPCEPGENGDFEGVDISTLLKNSGFTRIALLKMDVEGAEAVIFSKNVESWLDKVDAIAIELHDDSVFGNGSDVFFAAIKGHDFKVSRSGELTVCRRGCKTFRTRP